MRKLSYFCILILSLYILSPHCHAENIAFTLSLDKDQVSLGGSVQLSLTLYGVQNVSPPNMPQIESLQVRYMGPSSRMSIVNGKVSSSITFLYGLLPTKVGNFKIGPVLVYYNGQKYTSNTATLEVISGPVERRRSTGGLDERTDDLLERVSLEMKAGKDTAYVNELIPLTVRLYVDQLSMRDIHYPQFEHDGFSVEEFSKPRQFPEVRSGVQYEVLEFKTKMFGTRAGELKIGPAEVEGTILVRSSTRTSRSRSSRFFDDKFFNDFLGGYETYPLKLKSGEIPINILALPEQGKPKDFKGAVGKFNFNVLFSPDKVKAGDPIALNIEIRGDGNFNTVNCPELSSDEGFKIYEPQVVRQEEDVKVFEKVIIPKNAGVTEIPVIQFSFFDTQRKLYRTISKGPFPIGVVKPDKEEQIKIVEIPEGSKTPVEKEVLGRDIIYIKDSPGNLTVRGDYIYKRAWFLPSCIVPFILLGMIFVLRKRSDRLKSDVRYARSVRASKEAKEGIRKVKKALNTGDSNKFYDEVFKTLQEYLGDRLHLPTGGITADVVDEKLKGRNVKDSILQEMKEVFGECDMARYAPSELGRENMHNMFKKVKGLIEYFERERI